MLQRYVVNGPNNRDDILLTGHFLKDEYLSRHLQKALSLQTPKHLLYRKSSDTLKKQGF